MSFRDATKAQNTGPDGLKPVRGTPILDPSVEAKGVASDLCTAPPGATRGRILGWLAEGAREVTWALCSLPRQRWARVPPSPLSEWSALRHARHLARHEREVTLPAVRRALGVDAGAETLALESAEDIVHTLGQTRFELLHELESAPDDAWERPLPEPLAPDAADHTHPVQLDWLLLHARQHELEHLAAIWRIGLNWDRVSRTPTPGVPLHPADRLEESH
jgi:hypothetical protein